MKFLSNLGICKSSNNPHGLHKNCDLKHKRMNVLFLSDLGSTEDTRGEFNNANALKRSLYRYQALHITNKDIGTNQRALGELSHC